MNPDWMRLRAGDYLGEVDPAHPHASVVNADLSGLPPTLLQTGEVDPCLPGARVVAEGTGAVAAVWATVRQWVDEVVPPG